MTTTIQPAPRENPPGAPSGAATRNPFDGIPGVCCYCRRPHAEHRPGLCPLDPLARLRPVAAALRVHGAVRRARAYWRGEGAWYYRSASGEWFIVAYTAPAADFRAAEACELPAPRRPPADSETPANLGPWEPSALLLARAVAVEWLPCFAGEVACG